MAAPAGGSTTGGGGGGGGSGAGVGSLASAAKPTTVIATPGGGPDRPQEISYTDTKVIGNGSFGVVYQARLIHSGAVSSGSSAAAGASATNTSSSSQQHPHHPPVPPQQQQQPTSEMVAIKRVLQDKRFKNRELQIMRRLDHCNIVKLKYYFYTSGEKVREN